MLRDLLVAAAATAGRGVLAKAAAIGAVLLVFGLVLLTPIASMSSAPSATASCPVPLDGAQQPVLGGGSATSEQLQNAQTIADVAQDMGLPGQAVLVALMTALQESGLRNIDYGDRDSVGLFQQRPSQGWGTVEQIMDPVYSAGKFFQGLQKVNGWPEMAYTVAAQAVQRSAYPNAYARHEQTARDIAATLGIDLTRAGDPYGTGAPAETGTSGACGTVEVGDTTPQDCTEDDPTTAGCLTPRMLNLYTQVHDLYGAGWSCFSPRPGQKSDHSSGMACDVTFGNRVGERPTPEGEAEGWALCQYLLDNAAAFGLHYLIWQGQIITVESADQGWQPYNGGGMHDPDSVTGGHYDHVHISVY